VVSRWFPIAATRVRVRAEHVGFVVDKAALGQVFSEYFGFPCQSSFHQFFSIIIITRGWHNRPIGGRSAEWTQLDSNPTIRIKKNRLSFALGSPLYSYFTEAIHDNVISF
jgi:hypothetical protein